MTPENSVTPKPLDEARDGAAVECSASLDSDGEEQQMSNDCNKSAEVNGGTPFAEAWFGGVETKHKMRTTIMVGVLHAL